MTRLGPWQWFFRMAFTPNIFHWLAKSPHEKPQKNTRRRAPPFPSLHHSNSPHHLSPPFAAYVRLFFEKLFASAKKTNPANINHACRRKIWNFLKNFCLEKNYNLSDNPCRWKRNE